MNMFRDIFTVVFIALGIALWLTKPDDWQWIGFLGQWAVYTINVFMTIRPFSTITCFVIAVALWMTRKKY